MLCQTKTPCDNQGAWQYVIRPAVCCGRGAGWFVLFAVWAQAFGQVSVLDPSFKTGTDGAVNALVLQADQRILVGGEFTTIGGCSNSFLARLSSDGLVDTSFNPAGLTDGTVQRLLQQPDHKVLVGGAFTRLLGQPRTALARLLEDGSLDNTFDASAVLDTNAQVFALALQEDRLLVGYFQADDYSSRIVRLNTNGAPDPTFVCTNQISGYVFVLLPQPDGSVLFGGNWCSTDTSTNYSLFRLKPNGPVDDIFDAGLDMSSVFCLVRQPSGQILVGGLVYRRGTTNGVALLRLNSDLTWDDTFPTNTFGPPSAGTGGPSVSALLLQPDGKLIGGGDFYEVGGYWRRGIVRFTAAGHVDGCFDPGLGLGGNQIAGPVRALALQPDGRVLLGGSFWGVDTALAQGNLARFLPQSDCDLIRVYINGGDAAFAAATFPPGGTNYMEMSEDFSNWRTVLTNTSPFLYSWDLPTSNPPRAFFRGRQQR